MFSYAGVAFCLALPSANEISWHLFAQAGYIRIDGSVPSSERIQLVHKFQSDPETRVAVLSIQAAGQVHKYRHCIYEGL